MAGFGKQNRAAITFPGLLQHFVQSPSPTVTQVPRQALVIAHHPLIVVVVIGAYQIQIARMATQLRLMPARQHVPRLKLRGTKRFGLLNVCRVVIR